jgi:hypothetical protein
MKSARALKWVCIATLCGGSLFQNLSCGEMIRQSVVQGTFSWVTGALSSSVGNAGALTDLLLSVLASPGASS